MIFWTRQNYEDSKNSSGCQGLGCEGMNKQGTEDFYSQVNYSMWNSNGKFFQTHRIYNTKSETDCLNMDFSK